MSSITISMRHARIDFRDGNGTSHEQIDITSDQFLLAFQGAQAALPTLEKLRASIVIKTPEISLKYILDPSFYRYVQLSFEITLDPQILGDKQAVKGLCRQPTSIEAISNAIIVAVRQSIEVERTLREARLKRLDEFSSALNALA